MREPITLLIDIMLRKCENLPIFALWKSACVCYELLHLEDELRHLREERRTKCRSSTLSRYVGQFLGVKFRRKSLPQEGKKAQQHCGMRKTTRFPFFFFFSGTKDLRISRKKSCGRVNSVIAWSSLHPNLHPHESSPVGVSNASCFIFRACAGYNGRHIRSVVRTHLQNREYLWGIRWRRGWKDEKSLANLWRALCFSAKSRIHRKCVVRLLKTYVCRAERRAFATMYLTFKCTLRNMKSIGKISR